MRFDGDGAVDVRDHQHALARVETGQERARRRHEVERVVSCPSTHIASNEAGSRPEHMRDRAHETVAQCVVGNDEDADHAGDLRSWMSRGDVAGW